MLPVAPLHVGWVTESVGTEGVAGWAFTVFETAVDKQLELVVLVIMLYVPAVNAFDVALA